MGNALAEAADLAGLVPYVGTAIEYLINKIPRVRNARAAHMLKLLLELLETDVEGLLALLEKSDAFSELVAAAAEAAAVARLETKLRLLAEVALDAASKPDEPSLLDAAHLRVRTLTDLEAVHLDVLSDVARRSKAQISVEDLRITFKNQIALDAVLATLVQHGLLGMRDALVGFPGPMYHLTDYGRYILESFERVGSQSNDN